MESVVNDLGAVRSNIDSEFDTVYDQAMRMAERMNVIPSTPRMAERQMHRDTIEAANPKEYYVYVYVYVCFISIWRDIALYRYIV